MKCEVALGGLDEAEEELNKGGFACPCFADEGDVLALFDCEVDIFECGSRFVGVGEGDAFESKVKGRRSGKF